MKTVRVSLFVTCFLLLTSPANAAVFPLQQVLNHDDYNWANDYWFMEYGEILDHYPYCRGSNQDWGWTHDVSDLVPRSATGIASATLTILAWKIDVQDGEDDVVYVLPEEPASTSSIWRIGTELGLLKGYTEAPTDVVWPAEGQVGDYADLFSTTTFDLPADMVDELWTNKQIYVHLDIDQTSWDGMRATIISSTLTVNYLVPEGTTLPNVDVHRFWSPVLSGHFYTASEAEKDYLVANYSHVWTYEGIAYQTRADDSDPRAVPVYRFWSPVLSAHFYTISEEEATFLITNYSHIWVLEGPVFYAYAEDSQSEYRYPVYRFWSGTLSRHFYTINEAERDHLIANYSHVWTFEGIAWYVPEQQHSGWLD